MASPVETPPSPVEDESSGAANEEAAPASMSSWLAARPWIWIVLALVLFFLADLAFVAWALMTAPAPAPIIPGP